MKVVGGGNVHIAYLKLERPREMVLANTVKVDEDNVEHKSTGPRPKLRKDRCPQRLKMTNAAQQNYCCS